MSDFNVVTATQEPELDTAMKVIYQWNYDSEVDELRNLYVKATEAQWISNRDIAWDKPIDMERFAATPLGASIAIDQSSYWKSLPRETQWELTRRLASFRLSNFLHGEQGALMVAAQLVNAVPHTDAKFYAATQTMDEARHVEAFARYIEKLDEIRPIAPALKHILDGTLQTDDWMKKLVGMQIVVEGLALYSFRDMRNLTEEPLLKELLTYIARDESRHHAYGVQYISRCVPCLNEAQRTELEDFALEAARTLIDQRNQQTFFSSVLALWAEAGIDPVEMLNSVRNEREELTQDLGRGRRLGPVQGFVIPTLKRCGLLSERVAKHYHEFLKANFGTRILGDDVQEFLRHIPDLPEDTAAWVLGELH
ncbi:MAG: ferritin-like domain-containing protein [Deltaproteobacteria bacterium]|nr:ferritin-like domain-containing protein [Deltaproteobacteria bacterium]